MRVYCKILQSFDQSPIVMLKAFSYPLSLIIVVSIVFNSSFAQDYSTKAESLLKEAISDQSMVGISAGFSVKGNIIWKSGHGFKDQKKKIPFEANTISRIASVTKTMTAIAVLQLVEKGKLGLDDSFHSFFSRLSERFQRHIYHQAPPSAKLRGWSIYQ